MYSLMVPHVKLQLSGPYCAISCMLEQLGLQVAAEWTLSHALGIQSV